jgi:GTP-binding protein HflX
MLKFSSRPVAEHAEVPLADGGRWEEIVEHWGDRPTERKGSYVVSVGTDRDPRVRAAQLAEIVSLVKNQGDLVLGEEIVHLGHPNRRMLFGEGQAQEIAARARARGATMIVVDAELTPSQARNLEDTAGMAICDREAVILNVFLRHATTRRARIQVELAQLEYLRPRIRGVGIDMDQQTGGTPYARGPGETMSELLARKIDGRIEELQKALRKVEISAKTQRRQRASCKRMVLVGYTNAGKTSLMNAMTGAGLSARDMPFETLDTTSRCLTRHGGDIVISDTVGFIRRLPERLLASFESTLAEIDEASLLVIVVDASDHEIDLHVRSTLDLIERLGAANVPRFYVFNKTDRVSEPPDFARWTDGYPWIALSSHDARAVSDLEEALLGMLPREELTTFIPYSSTDLLSLVYGKCRIVDCEATDDGLALRVQGPFPVIARLRKEAGE